VRVRPYGTGLVACLGRAVQPAGDRVAAASAGVPVLREGHHGGCAALGYPGSVSYGPGINTEALLLTAYGNVPAERTADLIGMLTGIPVSPGFVDKASSRLDGKLQAAGFDEAMEAALAAEPALGADEAPVNVAAPYASPQTGEPDGAPAHADRAPALREADLAAGNDLPQARDDHRDPGVLHRVPDRRRVRRLPEAGQAGRGAAMLPAHHPPLPRRHPPRPRQPAVLGGDVIEILRAAHKLSEHQAVSGYWQTHATLQGWCRTGPNISGVHPP